MYSENIKKLNSILEEEYMAINSFDALIKHAKDTSIRSELEEIQQTHKQHVTKIFTKIQNLGGTPPNSIGIQGVVSETISNIKHIGTTDNTSYLKEALQGEYMGIKTVNELLDNNSDSSSSELLNSILSEYQTNVNSLNNIINNANNNQ